MATLSNLESNSVLWAKNIEIFLHSDHSQQNPKICVVVCPLLEDLLSSLQNANTFRKMDFIYWICNLSV